jgi:hypothetical protein
MIKAVVTCKCPRCRKGDIFCNTNHYAFGELFLMPERCRECGAKIDKEPGFFYGAMYVGYALSVAYLVSVYVAMVVLIGDFSIGTYLITGITTLLVLTPVVFRLSRSIWLTMFDKYDPDAITKFKKENEGKEVKIPCIEV